jgi:hypothetical protein
MHVKDEIKSAKGDAVPALRMDEYESTILGRGILPVKEIIDAGKNPAGPFILSSNRNRTRIRHLSLAPKRIMP